MYIFFFQFYDWQECLCDWHTEGTKGEVIIICVKIYKDRITYFGGKIVIHVINSLVFLPRVPEPLQIATYTNSLNPQHSLRGNHIKIKLKHWFYLYM